MYNYLSLLNQVLTSGERVSNRTGIDTLMIPGAMLKFDLRHGFPAVTTKQLFFNQVKGELLGFLEGAQSAARFRELGCKIWDANANAEGQPGFPNLWLRNPHRKGEDDLGKIYGVQWRNFDGYRIETVAGHTVNVSGTDQLHNALETVMRNPESRRILVSAWNPNQFDQMALHPCHVLFQLLPNPKTKIMHMTMYQRSCDMFLGVPFNIASYALLLELFSYWCGYRAGSLTMFLADVHIYENHINQVREQLTRAPMMPPALIIDDRVPTYEHIRPELFKDPNFKPIDHLITRLNAVGIDKIFLSGYKHHPAIKAPMAV